MPWAEGGAWSRKGEPRAGETVSGKSAEGGARGARLVVAMKVL